MKALILNSGMGKRMGNLTYNHPKCMTTIYAEETILSRQLKQLAEQGIKDIIITTGYFDEVLIEYCHSLHLPLNIKFVKILYILKQIISILFIAQEIFV